MDLLVSSEGSIFLHVCLCCEAGFILKCLSQLAAYKASLTFQDFNLKKLPALWWCNTSDEMLWGCYCGKDQGKWKLWVALKSPWEALYAPQSSRREMVLFRKTTTPFMQNTCSYRNDWSDVNVLSTIRVLPVSLPLGNVWLVPSCWSERRAIDFLPNKHRPASGWQQMW